MYNLKTVQLRYEILNEPIEALAEDLGLALHMVEQMVEKGGWKRWFPEDDRAFFLVDPDNLEEGEDLLTVRTDKYMEYTNAKLKIFNQAKNIAVAADLLDIEFTIMRRVREAVEYMDVTTPSDVKDLSMTYNNMLKRLQSTTIGISKDDDGSWPTVLIKDLSGS